MTLDFYFDPICPWCWITSRWLTEVSEHRALDVTWRPFSLLIKNDGPEMSERYREAATEGMKALRVIEAVRTDHGNDGVGVLYTELGRRFHHDKQTAPDLADVLTVSGFDTHYADEADSDQMTKKVQASMDDALGLLGDDVGVPLIVFGGTAGFFGPVISPAPSGQEAVALFEAIERIATTTGFYELKRTRDVGPLFGDRP